MRQSASEEYLTLSSMLGSLQRRIGRRIALIVGLAMGVFGVGGLLLVLSETSRTQVGTEKQLAMTLARTIGASFQTFDPRLGQHPVGDIAAELSEREEIHALEVFDDRGRIRWSADPRRRGAMVDGAIMRFIRTSTSGQRPVVEMSPDESVPSAVVALRKKSGCLPCHAKSPDPLGGIYVSASHPKLLGAAVGFQRQAAALVVLFVMLVTALLLFLIHRLVVARLSKLVRVMSRAEEGDFMVRAEVTSNDEIGLLASTFNKMLAKITDLRVEHIDKEREMSEVLDELSLKQELAKKSELLEAANDRINARLNQLSFLYNLGRDLASELELGSLLERFSALVNDSLGVPEFVVLLLDRAKSQLSVVKARSSVGFKEGEISDRPFAMHLGILADVTRARAPEYIPNLAQDGREVPFRAKRRLSGSLLLVPVVYQDNLIGLLSFSSPVIDAFREEDRELFVAVGNHAALALSNAQLFQKTLALSNTDGLTGILNRRAMEARLVLEWSRALRDSSNLSVVMIDIDHFKVYNDQHGHQLGDETLRRVARILERNIRKVDAVARYGGEEFVVILPRAGRAEALEVAAKLRRSVEQADFVQGYMQPLGRVTISCGVATSPEDADSIDLLINAADEALFRAKQAGRNQVVASSTHPSASSEEGEGAKGETLTGDASPMTSEPAAC